MERFAIELVIAAPPSRVWRALCDPAEVVRWDTSVVEALDAPSDYPQPGQHVRWRTRAGVARILHDRPQEVIPERRLRSSLRLGLLCFDETYALGAAADETETKLTVTMEVTVPIPVVGTLIGRWYALPVSRRAVAASMDALKRHCERTSGR